MGEAKRRGIAAVQEALVAMSVEAIGARIQVRWNQHEAATPFGQMAYFAEYLSLTGLYRRWIESTAHRARSSARTFASLGFRSVKIRVSRCFSSSFTIEIALSLGTGSG